MFKNVTPIWLPFLVDNLIEGKRKEEVEEEDREEVGYLLFLLRFCYKMEAYCPERSKDMA